MASTISRNVFGGARPAVGPFEPQRVRIFEKGLRRNGVYSSSDLFSRHGVADDLVVHIGDIHDVVELIAARSAASGAECPEK